MRRLGNIGISAKLYWGFGTVLALMLLVTATGIYSVNQSNAYFTDYRSLARETVQSGRVLTNLLMTRISVKDFVIRADDETIAAVERFEQATRHEIEQARKLGSRSELIALINRVERDMKNYVSLFKKVSSLQAKRNQLVLNVLDIVGPQIEKKLTEIMESAYLDADLETAYWGGATQHRLLLGRIYVAKYLIKNDEGSYLRANREFALMGDTMELLIHHLENPARLAMTHEVNALFEQYHTVFTTVYGIITERNLVIKGGLDRIGPAIAKELDQFNLMIKEMQDTLGPEAAENMRQASTSMAVLSVLAVLFSVFWALLVGRGISTPVADMTSAMHRLARGDRDVGIPALTNKDEIGVMARAVQRFVVAVEQARQAKDDFFATMSHELRTPLSAILGYCEIMKGAIHDPEQQQNLRYIQLAGHNQLALVNDLLDMSKIESGNFSVDEHPYSFSALIHEVQGMLSAKAQDAGLVLQFVQQNREPFELLGDDQRIKQILINLIGNAIKFTKEGAVTVTTEVVDGAIRFSVEDTGVGIKPENMKKLFKRFEQEDDSINRRFGGSGLGLFISLNLAELMGGTIVAESEYGKGSTFTLLIPYRQTELLDRWSEAGRTEQQSSEMMLFSGQVLLAEDTPAIQLLIRRMLEKLGVQVVTVGDGHEAVEQAATKSFDLILMDMQMPHMDGVEATRQIKASGNATPIIAVTANVMRKHREAFDEAGCDGFLEKPIDREKMTAVLIEHLQMVAHFQNELDVG